MRRCVILFAVLVLALSMVACGDSGTSSDSGGERTVKLAGSDEFFNNVDAMPAFEGVYGFTLESGEKLVLSGGDTAQTEKAVSEGTDGVNFGMAYGTDGAISDLGLIVLEDDKGAQLVYWPTPTIRKEVLDAHPEIEGLLKPVFESLTLEKLQELNARVQVNGEAATDVAVEHLTQIGVLPGAGDMSGSKGTVAVGSKIDTEGEVLGTMIVKVLEANGFKVDNKVKTGQTDIVRNALLAGEIDVYPEYTGAALIFFEGDERATVENFKDAEGGYELAKEMDAANGIVWLEPARANNTWAICAKKDFAEENGLATMSDFADYVNGK